MEGGLIVSSSPNTYLDRLQQDLMEILKMNLLGLSGCSELMSDELL